jgi:hypothetical protein
LTELVVYQVVAVQLSACSLDMISGTMSTIPQQNQYLALE